MATVVDYKLYRLVPKMVEFIVTTSSAPINLGLKKQAFRNDPSAAPQYLLPHSHTQYPHRLNDS